MSLSLNWGNIAGACHCNLARTWVLLYARASVGIQDVARFYFRRGRPRCHLQLVKYTQHTSSEDAMRLQEKEVEAAHLTPTTSAKDWQQLSRALNDWNGRSFGCSPAPALVRSSRQAQLQPQVATNFRSVLLFNARSCAGWLGCITRGNWLTALLKTLLQLPLSSEGTCYKPPGLFDLRQRATPTTTIAYSILSNPPADDDLRHLNMVKQW